MTRLTNRASPGNRGNSCASKAAHRATGPRDGPDRHSVPPGVHPVLASVTAFTLALLSFLVSVDGDFVFDDSEAVTGNKDVTMSDVPYSTIFRHDFWGNKLDSNASHKSYRPLTVISLRWSYWLAGGLYPRGFHVVNVLLHGAVCVLLLPFYDLLMGSQGQGHFSYWSMMSCLLFAVHPIHSESVAAVVGRADLLCAVTFLLSFLTYHRALIHFRSPGRGVSQAVLWLTCSMTLCVISTLCKEIGITVLGVCLVYDVIVFSKIPPLCLLGLKTSPHLTGSSWPCKLPMLRILLVIGTAILILIGRWQVMGSTPPTFQIVDNPHSFVDSMFLRFLNYNYLYSLNVWLLLCPLWLCFDWSMGCVPVIESLLDGRLLAVAAFWFASGALIGCCLRHPPGQQTRCVMMALALVVLPFLPASNVLFRVGFVVAERVLYLPSVGFVLLVICGLQRLSCHQRVNIKILTVAVASLILLYGLKSYQRSCAWLTEKSLFESGHNVCPLNAKVQYNIAKVHGDAGNEEFSIQKYKLAIRLNPQYDQAMNNLGNIYKDRGDLLEAEKLLLRATEVRSDFAAAWMNLAIVQASLNQSRNSEESYHTALKHRKNYPDCYYNLGNLYLSDGRQALALAAWRNATLLNPNHISAWSNMIILLDDLGRLSDLKLVSAEALKQNPTEAIIHYNLANALGKAGLYEEAEHYFLKAVELQPQAAMFQSNLAVLYHRWGQLQNAERCYQKALQLDPANAQTKQNYIMLLKKLGRGQGVQSSQNL